MTTVEAERAARLIPRLEAQADEYERQEMPDVAILVRLRAATYRDEIGRRTSGKAEEKHD